MKQPYFIDDNIWYKGKRQKPRKIYCYNLAIKGSIATFIDKNGEEYRLPLDRILYEEVKNKMRYYDEKYHKTLIKGDFEKLKVIIAEKRRELIDYGWIDYMIEGGVVSPDLSTIFIYSRSPYNGQYLQFRRELETEFKKITYDNAKAFEIVEVK